jgi:hypothetical protein
VCESGQADPVQAGQVKLNNLGMGVEQPGEVTAEDDIFEQDKKRMMLGYYYHLNPLVSRSFYPKKHFPWLSYRISIQDTFLNLHSIIQNGIPEGMDVLAS